MPYRANLDWLNFLLADVRGGLGPYVGVFLVTQAGWSPATIGAVLTVSGLIGIVMHTPAGAFIDATGAKRALLVGGTAALSGSALAIAFAPTVPVVLIADIGMAVLGAVFAPTVAAITVGLTPPEALAGRFGRNAVFDRAGNLFIAAVAGATGTMASQRAVFFLVPAFGVLAALAVLSIPAKAIDHDRARGLDRHGDGGGEEPIPWARLLSYRPLLVLAVTAAVFHFANAPMLPLASQKLALAHAGYESALTSAAIIMAQLATIPMALLVERANLIGRKPLLLLALSALPVRGALFAATDEPVWIIAGQILDGVGGGLFDTLLPLVLADIMRGSGRYNVSRGLVGTVQGIGGSLSNVVAGALVVGLGYNATFLTLSAFALVAPAIVLTAMPETRRPETLPAA